MKLPFMITRLLRYVRSWKAEDDATSTSFFRYTTGRWLDNEAAELQKRYLRFDIDGLKAAAVFAVDGASSVLEITKMTEGACCKIFSILLDNHKEVIARLPTPHAGPGHLVTASEVATMEFARTRMGIPVPRVLSWSRDSSANTVGAEFIIMEKASGIELSSKVWVDIPSEQKLTVVKEVANIEEAILKYRFPAYGSLFFRQDIQPGMNAIAIDDSFAIGACMERQFWDEISSTMNHDHGPWVHPTQYLDAIYRREVQVLKSGSYEIEQSFRTTLEAERDPSEILSLLDRFASVIRYIVPTTPELTLPTLQHHDLNGGNIFISESELAQGRILITSVIDWQHTAILPLYLQAGTPDAFSYHSPWDLPPGLTIPSKPKRIEHASDADFEKAMSDYLGKLWVIGYRAHFYDSMPEYYKSLTDPYIQAFVGIAKTAMLTCDTIKSMYYLRERLMRLQTAWPNITSEPCPLCISDEEKRVWRSEGKEWQAHQDQLDELCDFIGVNDEGWVHAEDFDVVYSRYKVVKEEWLETGGSEDDWPFTGPEPDT